MNAKIWTILGLIAIGLVLVMLIPAAAGAPRQTDILPTVTLPPVTLPGVTITPPTIVVTKLITINPPPVTVSADPVTVGVPGSTVTLKNNTTATGTKTFVSRPTATVTVTQRPSVGPGLQSTQSAAPTGSNSTPRDTKTRQVFVPRDSIDSGGLNIPVISDLPKPVQIGLGLVTVLLLMALILAGMYGGYALGRREEKDKQASFLKALLNYAKYER